LAFEQIAKVLSILFIFIRLAGIIPQRQTIFGFWLLQKSAAGENRRTGLRFKFLSGISGQVPAFLRCFLILVESLSIISLRNAGRRQLTQHGKDQFLVGHMISQVLAV
jgi:hypothetical protein